MAVARGAGRVDDVTAHLVAVDDEAARAQMVLATADAVVFGCPTYMGSVSAQFKAFMDSTSAIWALQGWRDKLAAGFTHSAALSGDKLATLIQLSVFAAQHGMIWVGLGLPPTYASLDAPSEDMNRLGSHLGAMAQSRPSGGDLPESDLRTAEHLGRRVAELARRFHAGKTLREASSQTLVPRHPTARAWQFPSGERAPLPLGVERTNLREIAARQDRFEHHLLVCATVDGARLEVTSASEPLAFAHINVSDEYAIALPSGDDLVDRFPLRTFLTDPDTGRDVGRYNHRVGDLVLHPQGLLHWPGRLRPPYEPFDFPPGMRRCGLSLVYCASEPLPHTWCPLSSPGGREADTKAYVDPAPPMVLASLRGRPGLLGKIGRTELSLVELPETLAPPLGGWVVVLEVDASSLFAPCDLVRIGEGKKLEDTGIVRALLLTSDGRGPDPVPHSWHETPSPPMPPYEDAPPGALPFERYGVRASEISKNVCALEIGEVGTEVPRHWLARTLYRVGLHGLRLGYVETYGGFFVDDRDDDVRIGIRPEAPLAPTSVRVSRGDALDLIEGLYRAVAPPGYSERLA